MRKFGFTDVEILKETGTVFNGITLYKTGCIHGKPSAAMPYYKKYGFRPDAMGVVFKAAGEKTVYLAGDTIWCDFVKNAVDKFAPEIINLPRKLLSSTPRRHSLYTADRLLWVRKILPHCAAMPPMPQ